MVSKFALQASSHHKLMVAKSSFHTSAKAQADNSCSLSLHKRPYLWDAPFEDKYSESHYRTCQLLAAGAQTAANAFLKPVFFHFTLIS